MNRAVFAVDLYNNIGFLAVVFLCGRYERSLDPLENDFLVDVLVTMDRIDDSQNFLGIHGNLSAAYSPAATANQVVRVFQIVEFRARLSDANAKIVSPPRPAETERRSAHRSETHCAKPTYSVWRTLKSIPQQC
jgi:hypothetical protein